MLFALFASVLCLASCDPVSYKTGTVYFTLKDLLNPHSGACRVPAHDIGILTNHRVAAVSVRLGMARQLTLDPTASQDYCGLCIKFVAPWAPDRHYLGIIGDVADGVREADIVLDHKSFHELFEMSKLPGGPNAGTQGTADDVGILNGFCWTMVRCPDVVVTISD